MNNLNPTTRHLSFNIIQEFLNTKKQLREILNNHFNNNSLSQRDKSFITELCYGSIRYYFFLKHNIYLYLNLKKVTNRDFSILLLGSYQIYFMNSVPDYASISTSVDVAKKECPNKFKFINAVLRKISSNKDSLKNIPIYIKESFPKWLYEMYLDDFGDSLTNKIMNEQNKRPYHWIRIVRNKKYVLEQIQLNNIEFVFNEDNSDFIRITNINKKIIYLLLNKGFVYIQSPSSGFVSMILNPLEKDNIIDACASPGGKLSYIHHMIQNKKIQLAAFEIDKNRYELLVRNLETLKIENVNIYNDDFLNCKLNNINKILIDTPCSGTGSINKKPDIKIRRSEKDYKFFTELQLKLLEHASTLLKTNGEIIYSTCSLNSIENWSIIETFMKNNGNFHIAPLTDLVPDKYIDKKGALFIVPHIHKLDGIFAVKIKMK